MERPHPELEFEARFETPVEFIDTIKKQLQTDEEHALHIYNAVTRGHENPILRDASNVYLNVLDSAVVVTQFIHFPEQVFTGGRRVSSEEAYDFIAHKVSYHMYQGTTEPVAEETVRSIALLFMDFGERIVQNNQLVTQERTGWGKQVA